MVHDKKGEIVTGTKDNTKTQSTLVLRAFDKTVSHAFQKRSQDPMLLLLPLDRLGKQSSSVLGVPSKTHVS